MDDTEIGQVLIFILLLFNSVVDIRKKRISLLSVGIYIVFWLIFGLKECVWQEVLLGLVPGFLLIIISLITKGSIGMGDGILVLAMGLFSDWEMLLWVMSAAFLLSFIWALMQICFRKGNKKTFPFVPFILLGYLIVLMF